MFGGFLRQMNDTLKYNRELLQKSKRKPFDREMYLGLRSKGVVWNDKPASPELLQIIRSRARWQDRKDQITTWILLSILATAGGVGLWAVYTW